MDKITGLLKNLPPLPTGAVTMQMLLEQTPPRYGMVTLKPVDLYNRLNQHVYQHVNTLYASANEDGQYYVCRMMSMHEVILPHLAIPACVLIISNVLSTTTSTSSAHTTS